MTVRYAYPATLEAEADGGVTAYFDGLPGATWAPTEAEVLIQAKDLLASALEMLIEDGDPLPAPPPSAGRPIVEAEIDPNSLS
jgi:antitoxin HicB